MGVKLGFFFTLREEHRLRVSENRVLSHPKVFFFRNSNVLVIWRFLCLISSEGSIAYNVPRHGVDKHCVF